MTKHESDRVVRIINDIVVAVKTDIFPIIQPDKPEGGYFGVTRSVLCYVDVLGLLYCGWRGKLSKTGKKIDFATPEKGKTFIREVMSQVDESYGNHGDLLYDMYRHGTVHLHAPKKMASAIDPAKTIEWLIYKGGREHWEYYENKTFKFRHLKITEWEHNRFLLPVSIIILYNDLLESIDLYKKLIFSEKSGDLKTKFLTVANGLVEHFDPTQEKFWE